MVPASPVACGAELVSEPISPELVLVDPELARRERARALQRANSEALAGAAVGRQEALGTQTLAREPPQRHHRRWLVRGSVSRFALFALCLIGLMALGVFVALRLHGERGNPRTLALPQVTRHNRSIGSVAGSASGSRATSLPLGSSTAPRRQEATPKQQRSGSRRTPGPAVKRGKQRKAPTPKRGAARAGAKLPIETRASVERKLLALVIQSPAGKLPPSLIDRKTGLAKNNLQAICRHTSNSRSFHCVVKSAVKPSDGRVYVSYQPTHDGRGRFTWSHRSG